MPRLILASASPRRRELLASLGAPFEVIVPRVEEHEDPATDPREMVSQNAALKADAVARMHPDDVVLGADTTVFLEGRALNKPRDLNEARAMLRSLSGRTHTVFTGLALRRGTDGLKLDELVSSEVTFRVLTAEAIETYLSLVHVLDKAGAYAIQEHPEIIVAAHRGSLSNIVGLPVERTKQILTRCGLLADPASVDDPAAS